MLRTLIRERTSSDLTVDCSSCDESYVSYTEPDEKNMWDTSSTQVLFNNDSITDSDVVVEDGTSGAHHPPAKRRSYIVNLLSSDSGRAKAKGRTEHGDCGDIIIIPKRPSQNMSGSEESGLKDSSSSLQARIYGTRSRSPLMDVSSDRSKYSDSIFKVFIKPEEEIIRKKKLVLVDDNAFANVTLSSLRNMKRNISDPRRKLDERGFDSNSAVTDSSDSENVPLGLPKKESRAVPEKIISRRRSVHFEPGTKETSSGNQGKIKKKTPLSPPPPTDLPEASPFFNDVRKIRGKVRHQRATATPQEKKTPEAGENFSKQVRRIRRASSSRHGSKNDVHHDKVTQEIPSKVAQEEDEEPKNPVAPLESEESVGSELQEEAQNCEDEKAVVACSSAESGASSDAHFPAEELPRKQRSSPDIVMRKEVQVKEVRSQPNPQCEAPSDADNVSTASCKDHDDCPEDVTDVVIAATESDCKYEKVEISLGRDSCPSPPACATPPQYKTSKGSLKESKIVEKVSQNVAKKYPYMANFSRKVYLQTLEFIQKLTEKHEVNDIKDFELYLSKMMELKKIVEGQEAILLPSKEGNKIVDTLKKSGKKDEPKEVPINQDTKPKSQKGSQSSRRKDPLQSNRTWQQLVHRRRKNKTKKSFQEERYETKEEKPCQEVKHETKEEKPRETEIVSPNCVENPATKDDLPEGHNNVVQEERQIMGGNEGNEAQEKNEDESPKTDEQDLTNVENTSSPINIQDSAKELDIEKEAHDLNQSPANIIQEENVMNKSQELLTEIPSNCLETVTVQNIREVDNDTPCEVLSTDPVGGATEESLAEPIPAAALAQEPINEQSHVVYENIDSSELPPTESNGDSEDIANSCREFVLLNPPPIDPEELPVPESQNVTSQQGNGFSIQVSPEVSFSRDDPSRASTTDDDSGCDVVNLSRVGHQRPPSRKPHMESFAERELFATVASFNSRLPRPSSSAGSSRNHEPATEQIVHPRAPPPPRMHYTLNEKNTRFPGQLKSALKDLRRRKSKENNNSKQNTPIIIHYSGPLLEGCTNSRAGSSRGSKTKNNTQTNIEDKGDSIKPDKIAPEIWRNKILRTRRKIHRTGSPLSESAGFTRPSTSSMSSRVSTPTTPTLGVGWGRREPWTGPPLKKEATPLMKDKKLEALKKEMHRRVKEQKPIWERMDFRPPTEAVEARAQHEARLFGARRAATPIRTSAASSTASSVSGTAQWRSRYRNTPLVVSHRPC